MHKCYFWLIAIFTSLNLWGQQEQSISFTTAKAVGENITLNIIADDQITIEGLEGEYNPAVDVSYKVVSQEITLRGPITDFNANGCAITTFHITHPKSLVWLTLNDNMLRRLDLSECRVLAQLQCANNQLKELNLLQNESLQQLFVDNNYLTELDLSACTLLSTVNCSDNLLSSLDLSECPYLNQLFVYSNRFRGKGVDAFVAHMPKLSINAQRGAVVLLSTIDPCEKNYFTEAQTAAMKEKGWTLKCRMNKEYYQPYLDEYAHNGTVPPGERTSVLLEVGDNMLDKNISFVVTVPEGETVNMGKGIQGEWRNGERVSYLVTGPIIDITGHHLREVTVDHCGLKAVDLTLAKYITALDCRNNIIALITGSENAELRKLLCSQNQLCDKALGSLLIALPTIAGEEKPGLLGIYDDSSLPEGNLVSDKRIKEAKEKGWQACKWDAKDNKWIPFEGTPSVALSATKDAPYKIRTDNRGIHIDPLGKEDPGVLSVYMLSGEQIRHIPLNQSEQFVALPYGIYILQIGTYVRKIIIE